MFSKKLALFIVMSLLAAAPAFAAGVDVHTDDGTVTTDGHVDRPDQKDQGVDQAATRDNKANDPKSSKEEADRVKALTADHMTTNPTGDKANSDIQAKIEAAKAGTAVKADPIEAEVQTVDLQMNSVGANTPKDNAANAELAKENPENFRNFEANVAGGQAELAKIKDPVVLVRLRKMLRALRDSYIALRLTHTSKSADYWRDAIVTYARSIAGDNWAAIEEGAARLNSLTEQAAKLQSAKDYIKSKHPNMKDDIVDEIAKEIVIQKSCV